MPEQLKISVSYYIWTDGQTDGRMDGRIKWKFFTTHFLTVCLHEIENEKSEFHIFQSYRPVRLVRCYIKTMVVPTTS